MKDVSLAQRVRRSGLLAGLVTLLSQAAMASGAIGPNGARIETSRYAIDLFQGALWAGARVTSLGGAYVAIAWDVDGMLQNPAAPAVRPFFSVSPFDYWLGLAVTFPATLTDIDFFNSGSKTQIQSSPDGVLFLTPAAMLQFDAVGVGVSMELQNYGLGTVTGDDGSSMRVSTSFNVAHFQVAYAFQRGALVLGMGTRFLRMSVHRESDLIDPSAPVRASGTGVELGALWKPEGEIFSLGAAFRSGISAQATFSDAAAFNGDGDIVIADGGDDIYLPERAVLPWDLNVGVALTLGAERRNQPWRSVRDVAERDELRIRLRMLERRDARDRELLRARSAEERALIVARGEELEARDDAALDSARERGYWALQQRMALAPRRHVVLAASALITGSVEQAVGVESFLTQAVNRSGESVVVSPRLGAEMEVVPDWLRIRSGTYLEPTRFDTSTARPHYTLGFDLRGPRWSVFGLWPSDYLWRIGVGGDLARNYSTLGVTIAGWYPRHRGPLRRGGGE